MFPELWTPLDFTRIHGLRRLDTIEDLANHLDTIIIGKIILFHLIFYFDLSFLDTPTTSTQNHTTRVDIDARFLEFVGLSCINPDNYYHLPRLMRHRPATPQHSYSHTMPYWELNTDDSSGTIVDELITRNADINTALRIMLGVVMVYFIVLSVILLAC